MLDDRRIAGVFLLVLIALAGYVFFPLWPDLLLAAWVAIVARPLMLRLVPRLRGPKRAALATTTIVLLGVVVPLIVVTIPLVLGVVALVRKLIESGTAARALETVVQSNGAESASETLKFDAQHAIALAREHGTQAIDVLATVAGSTMNVLLGFFVFMVGTYEFLAHGPELNIWFRERLPLPHLVYGRLSAAFVETGRGLFVGVGLTSITQGLIATVSYVCLGIPRALVLGAVTTITSLFPGVGTALVWVPVSVGLYISGRHVSAFIMLVVGAVVIGSVDNFLRPVFARYGNFRLSSFATLLAMFGGLTVFGSWGLLLGPLVVRVGVEAMELLYEMRSSERP